MAGESVEAVETRAETPLDEAELFEAGREARATLPRSAHAEFAPSPGRDPNRILRRQHESRLPDLVQLRVERMSADPFAFYRGTAAIQAADLAAGPSTGVEVVLCGDAHLANFGIYRSPEKALVFDINDFDEAFVGPWEWDVKRLLGSVVLAGRSLGLPARQTRAITLTAGAAYRDSLREALAKPLLDRYFSPVLVSERRKFSADTERMIRQTVKASGKRTSERVAERLLEPDGSGGRRFAVRPPVLTPLEPISRALVDEVFERYRATLPADLALLLSQYSVVDAARRVVGVGSVGTRCFILALQDSTGDILVLQLKEAGDSVIEQFGGIAPVTGYLDAALSADQHGYRVVACQRILQSVSDPFLGYLSVAGYRFYVRMFRNHNASFDIPSMNRIQFEDYSRSCAATLARAHARSPKAAFVAGYMGRGDAFVTAASEWAHAYADQAEQDYAGFVAAAREGWFGEAG